MRGTPAPPREQAFCARYSQQRPRNRGGSIVSEVLTDCDLLGELQARNGV
jgi:hypothetical protein